MSLIEWVILIGFGVPIVSLCSLFVYCASALQNAEVRKDG